MFFSIMMNVLLNIDMQDIILPVDFRKQVFELLVVHTI